MKNSLKRLGAAFFIALAILGSQWVQHEAVAQSNQYQVKISQLPVPASGSTYLSAGDVVGANRNNITYRLTTNFGAGCLSHQWVSAISAQGYGSCTQPGYSDISGLGTAATATLGTSGATVPVLSSNVTWSGSPIFTGAVPSLSNGNLGLGASTTGGGVLGGKGSSFDVTIENGSGASICTVATGTTTFNCIGLQVAGANVLTSGGASGVTLGSATTANPQISGAPTSGFYTSGGTISEEISGAQISNWAASGFSVNTGTYQIGGAQVLSAYSTEITSLGLGALTSGTNMNYSTAIGALALHNGVAGGEYNTAIGAEALYSTTSGQRNTAVGYSAVHNASATTGDNTGIGYDALVNATGAANTALGSGAGSHITTGTQNVIIGPNVASSTLTIGTNNIIIGTSSAADATTSSTSNTFWLGGGSTAIFFVTSTNATPNVTVPGNFTVSGTCTGCGSSAGTVNGSTAASVAYYTTSGTAVSGGGALTESTTFVADSGTLSVTGVSTLSGGIAGTITADNPCATCVGFYLSNTTTQGQSIAISSGSGAGGNAATIALTPGDWDVYANIYYNPAPTAVISGEFAMISTTSGTIAANPPGTMGYALFDGMFGAGASATVALGPIRASLSATTTYYAVGAALFSTSTNGVYGTISARRVR